MLWRGLALQIIVRVRVNLVRVRVNPGEPEFVDILFSRTFQGEEPLITGGGR